MLSIEDIHSGAIRLIHELISKEFRAQGHELTGQWTASLDGKTVKNPRSINLEGYALTYGAVLNKGLEPNEISAKMIPGLIEYFIKRGLDPVKAKQAASATFNKWKGEGMSTEASKRFSETGGRQNFIEAAFTNPSIDEYMSITFDASIEEHYRLSKSETI